MNYHATHKTSKKAKNYIVQGQSIEFPLKHPDYMMANYKAISSQKNIFFI